MELARILKGHEQCDPSNCQQQEGTKCQRIGIEGSEPSFAIDEYYVYEKRDVCEIGVQPRENYGWDISFKESQKEGLPSYYFCVDGIYHDAWAHWVEESAIYLPLYLKLKKLYPSLKIYSFGKKGYKDAMYKAFGIDQVDVVYSIENEVNLCLFPYYISLGDHRRPYQFFRYMKNFYDWIVSHCPPIEKDIDILYLPRGSKENYKQNERQIPVQSQLLQIFSEYPHIQVFFTDSVDNMLDQWTLIRRAKLILLSEGSNLLINGFFAEGSEVVVLGGNGNNAHLWNPSPALVYFDTLKRGNRYYHVPYEWNAGMILSLLTAVTNGAVAAQPIPQFKCYLNCKYCRFQDFTH